ncbi:hypothetical protein C2869_21545 [Saccharobesus litoralis]|uniref:RNase E specificity factor CsrD n=1 Tax=Saccharobesus litoralis TaxID=2172099 RepID=A0A2S0VX91_9ALTE|nr:EAL domain-containing protein [Saccharobesus litoralis]AWB68824.1 hypothetical protein C2869_21545 [Saccharobesus litoralis]
MNKLPLKTSVRAVRLWRNYIIAALAQVLILICVVFNLIHSAENSQHYQAKFADLPVEQVSWQTITYSQLTSLAWSQQFDAIHVFPRVLESKELESKELEPKQLDLNKQSIPRVFRFHKEQVLSWQASHTIQTADAKLEFVYTLISTRFLLTSIACGFILILLLASIVYLLADVVEGKFRKLERKARKLGIAKRRSEQIKYRSVIRLVDSLLDELAWTRKEQNRVDKFIRSQTFLDPELGIGNRLFFDHRFDAALADDSNSLGGAVLLLHLQELDRIENEYGVEQAHQILSSTVSILNQTFRLSPEPLLARRAYAEIAVLMLGIAERDLMKHADNLVRRLQRLDLPNSVNPDCFFHIGIARFTNQDKAFKILSEADMALRRAQLEGHVGWFMYEDEDKPREIAMGSLKWRTFIERALQQESFVLYFQPILSVRDQAIHHQEATLKVRDSEGKMLQAGVFMPMAHKCGLQSEIEKLALRKLFDLFNQDASSTQSSCINISVDSLLDAEFCQWLFAFLQEHETANDRLIISLTEYNLYQHSDKLTDVLQQLCDKGIRLLVEQVGQYVINSSYVKQHPIAYIKLHSSIIRNIDQHPENQLFIRSLLANCAGGVRVFGYGIESEEEWSQLKALNIHGGQGSYFNQALNEFI